MFIDGENNLSYDAVYIGAPAEMVWPTDIKKALTGYEKTWQSYADAEANLLTLLGDRDLAPALDGQRMRQAAREGSGDPGTPNQDAARRAVEFAKVVLQEKAGLAREATGAIRALVTQHADQLMTAAIELESLKVERVRQAQDAAQLAWMEADDNARSTGQSINWIIDLLENPSLNQYRVEHLPVSVGWPSTYERGQHHTAERLDALRRQINPPPAAIATTENTFDSTRPDVFI
jgi:hypothetical protein